MSSLSLCPKNTCFDLERTGERRVVERRKAINSIGTVRKFKNAVFLNFPALYLFGIHRGPINTSKCLKEFFNRLQQKTPGPYTEIQPVFSDKLVPSGQRHNLQGSFL
jgi:hypothetical protein